MQTPLPREHQIEELVHTRLEKGIDENRHKKPLPIITLTGPAGGLWSGGLWYGANPQGSRGTPLTTVDASVAVNRSG